MIFYLRQDIKEKLNSNCSFEKILTMPGKTYRHVKNRRTFSIDLDNKTYFIKAHLGVGWKEILKNIFSFKIPVLGAQNEWQAILKCEQLNIPTMKIAGYGKKGISPAKQKSFLITDALQNITTLEDFCPQHLSDSSEKVLQLKKKIICEIAEIARKLHGENITHHDMYICHFLLDTSQNNLTTNTIKLYLIDLHRAQRHSFLLKRFIIKDLAAIYFSAMDIPLNKEDIHLFIKTYSGKSLSIMSNNEKKFWQQVEKRAISLYQKIHKRLPNRNTNDTNI